MNNKIIIDNITLQHIQDQDIDNMIALLTNETIKKTYMLPDFKNPKEAIDLFHKIKQLNYATF